MEIGIIFGGLVALFFLYAIVKNCLNPPKEIPWNEVPLELQQAVTTTLPGFQVKTVRHLPAVHKYQLNGSYQDRPFKGKLERNSKGQLREIDFEDRTPGYSILRKQICELADLSPEALTCMGELLGTEREAFQLVRVSQGFLAEEPVFAIDAKTPENSWEFEITHSGRLLELEKKPRSSSHHF